jgi:methylthioribose-1-phosphate isomerase
MNIDYVPTRTIKPAENNAAVLIIDQTLLPHKLEWARMETLSDACKAIADMQVRGAPLIGATAAYGIALAMKADASDAALDHAYDALLATRPTAINLRWALDRMRQRLAPLAPAKRNAAAWIEAARICDEDVAANSLLGDHGLTMLRALWRKKRAKGEEPLNVLTHCNAGWLAAVDWGTALAPVYKAHDAGIPIHVWVDETRPRGQGAALTACELGWHGIAHTVIADNAGGHLMQHGRVDFCIVGTDRTSANGDVANKIGTYLKALAAFDNNVPFYVGLPSSTIDWTIADGVKDIPIEERSPLEVTHVRGLNSKGRIGSVQVTPKGSAAGNWGFDVTPARLITGLITERGICAASREGLLSLFPEFATRAAQ